jgi:hypothetical protein
MCFVRNAFQPVKRLTVVSGLSNGTHLDARKLMVPATRGEAENDVASTSKQERFRLAPNTIAFVARVKDRVRAVDEIERSLKQPLDDRRRNELGRGRSVIERRDTCEASPTVSGGPSTTACVRTRLPRNLALDIVAGTIYSCGEWS